MGVLRTAPSRFFEETWALKMPKELCVSTPLPCNAVIRVPASFIQQHIVSFMQRRLYVPPGFHIAEEENAVQCIL